MLSSSHGGRKRATAGLKRWELLRRGGIGLAELILPAVVGPGSARAAASTTIVIWDPEPFEGWHKNIQDTIQTFQR